MSGGDESNVKEKSYARRWRMLNGRVGVVDMLAALSSTTMPIQITCSYSTTVLVGVQFAAFDGSIIGL